MSIFLTKSFKFEFPNVLYTLMCLRIAPSHTEVWWYMRVRAKTLLRKLASRPRKDIESVCSDRNIWKENDNHFPK